MNPDYVAPPPAYSEQEFDQKVSQATALSILTPTPTFDGEGWQRYDPNAFNRTPVSPSSPAATVDVRKTPSNPPTPSHSNGASTQHAQMALSMPNAYHDKSKPINNLPPIVPLRIEKKSRTQYGKLVGDQVYPDSKGSFASGPNPMSNAGSSGTSPNRYYGGNYSQDSQGNVSRPNPSPTPPSSFGRLTSLTGQPPVVAPIYQSGSEEETYDPYRDYQEPQPQTYSSSRQSLPVIPQVTQRPTYTHTRSRSETHHPPTIPRLQFDPAVAYGKSTSNPVTAIQAIHANIPVSPVSSLQYDPHSLYHSTVSSKMLPMRPSPGETYQLSHPYDPAASQGQVMAGPRAGQQSQLFNDPERNSLPLTIDNSRQMPWQSPSRPISTYPTATTPRPNSTSDTSRFSQYSNPTARESVYSNENSWYPSR